MKAKSTLSRENAEKMICGRMARDSVERTNAIAEKNRTFVRFEQGAGVGRRKQFWRQMQSFLPEEAAAGWADSTKET